MNAVRLPNFWKQFLPQNIWVALSLKAELTLDDNVMWVMYMGPSVCFIRLIKGCKEIRTKLWALFTLLFSYQQYQKNDVDTQSLQ